MEFDRLLFGGHAFRRMAERGISPAEWRKSFVVAKLSKQSPIAIS
jgi:hypothetical protein